MVILTFIIILIEIIPLIKKKQRKEAVILLVFGTITLLYGYYYSTHTYTASLIGLIFQLLNAR